MKIKQIITTDTKTLYECIVKFEDGSEKKFNKREQYREFVNKNWSKIEGYFLKANEKRIAKPQYGRRENNGNK